jgi:cell division protein FtsI (penicillin-binding protein 3)
VEILEEEVLNRISHFRFHLLLCFVMGSFIAVWMRGAQLQLLKDKRIEVVKARQYNSTLTLHSRRGTIIDHRGRELATSIRSYSLFADPQIIQNEAYASKTLGKILRRSPRHLKKIFEQKSRRFVWLVRHLDEKTFREISALQLRGLGFVEDYRRVYPNEELASSLIGFVGREGLGLEGLEAFYNAELGGRKERISVRRDARGRPLLDDRLLLTEKFKNKNLRLNIDLEVQFFLEQELRKILKETEADQALGVILDAQTARIVAISNIHPKMNSINGSRFRNTTLVDSFEPGSVMKVFTVAAGLREGKIHPAQTFEMQDGRLQIGGRIIREADRSKKGDRLDITEILAYSSNVGSSLIAFKVGDKALHQTLLDFGFGQRLGVDFPGEARGILHPPPWNQHLLANISFGHGMTATPLQIAAAYAAIANGGKLYQPQLIHSLEDPFTGEVQKVEPKLLRTVLEPQTAQILRVMLTQSTQIGTGLSARVPGYFVGGKTGTAQKVRRDQRGYESNAYISSFCGFFPADRPQYVIYIAVDHPKGRQVYGSQVAAPVFSEVAGFLARRDGVRPSVVAPGIVGRQSLSQNPSDRRPSSGNIEVTQTSGPDSTSLKLAQELALKKLQEKFFQDGNETDHSRDFYKARGPNIPQRNTIIIQ